MSMLRSLESPEHARLRFLGTVVLTENKAPVYISRIQEDWSMDCIDLASNKSLTVKDIRNGIITTPVSLGFCQVGREALYLARRPSRRSKQGLDLEDVFINHTIGGTDFNISTSFCKKALAKTILGDFCSFKKAISSLEKEEDDQLSLSFHKDWAVYNEGKEKFIVYKFFGRCGSVEDGKVTLFNNFSYLRETLEEDVGNVHS
jgi:hypothetical protein